MRRNCYVIINISGIIFGVLACCPIWALLFNVESILLLLGQDPGVVALAQEYILVFFPGVLAYCWLFILMRYLLCQNRVLPNLVVCVVSCVINATLHYGLVVQAQMGIRGSAIALATTYYLVLAQLFAYIWGSGVYVETWNGWTWDNLRQWGQFARVTCSSIFMTFLYWLCTEAGTFLSGVLGEKEISAYSITFQVEGFVWMNRYIALIQFWLDVSVISAGTFSRTVPLSTSIARLARLNHKSPHNAIYSTEKEYWDDPLLLRL
ncbi:hypothetical protein LSAT2_028819 [Lamellibrachia satsuma]|nr:hypothetical protein LSAT2_028819 [Lamellibrachia satsuma]